VRRQDHSDAARPNQRLAPVIVICVRFICARLRLSPAGSL